VERRVRARLCTLAAGVAIAAFARGAAADDIANLRNLSIEELANVDVTSVSKTAQPLGEAPAAVYVITHDDIMRSGATTLPEILRLAPNLQVAVINGYSYAITARGFNGNAADKLLVMIDGRSVYTPLFGGVEWDQQEVPPEDIERIEVISGPGATLWGANAVNGVINIITRKSASTSGGEAEIEGGNRQHRVSLQYGGRISDDMTYRAYVDASSAPDDKTNLGTSADDAWSKTQGGFRLDWSPAHDQLTLEGDLYHATERVSDALDSNLSGGDVQLGWTHDFGGGSSLQVLSYLDQTRDFSSAGGFSLTTYDIEAQDNLAIGSRQSLVWGAGYRLYVDNFKNFGDVVYLPNSSAEAVIDAFAQDTVSLTSAVKLTLGLKFEKDPYAGVSPLPSARLSWKLSDNALLWAAASRAVRAPTLFDEDLQDTVVPGVLIIQGNHQFEPEKLTAYEIGGRFELSDRASLSVSAYYNTYDDLRSVEWVRMNALPLLLAWGNMMEGDTYGVEAWADYRLTDWWRLSGGVDLLHEDLHFKSGASSVNNLAEAGDDPGGQAQLRSSMDLGHRVTLQADVRYVAALPNPQIPAYTEANLSLAWQVTPKLQLSASGFNLLNPHHVEYEEAGAVDGVEVQRAFLVGAKVRF
jgi:iron complex outermembrane receptor protein